MGPSSGPRRRWNSLAKRGRHDERIVRAAAKPINNSACVQFGKRSQLRRQRPLFAHFVRKLRNANKRGSDAKLGERHGRAEGCRRYLAAAANELLAAEPLGNLAHLFVAAKSRRTQHKARDSEQALSMRPEPDGVRMQEESLQVLVDDSEIRVARVVIYSGAHKNTQISHSIREPA